MNETVIVPVPEAGTLSSARMTPTTATAPLNAPTEKKARVRTKYEDKPPSIKGIEWSKNRSGGWDCRIFRELPDGSIADRKYIGYLGKRQLKEWRANYKGLELRQVIANWVAEQQAQKGIH